MRLTVFFAVLALTLPGCTAISAVSDATRILDVYELRTPDIPRRGANQAVEVVVEEPIASGALTTERIMIRPGPFQAQYLADAQWADPAPIMLQTLLVRTLTESGTFTSVGRRPVGTRADFAVLSELTDFQAETAGEGATVRIALRLRLVRESDARVIASRGFQATQAAPNTNPQTLVSAFDAATSALLIDASGWISGRIAGAS